MEIAAAAARLDPQQLRVLAQSPEIARRVGGTSAEFAPHQVNQRPTFLIEDVIGDKAGFSGLVKIEPLAATLDAMLGDVADYAAFKARHGDLPSA